MVTALSAPQTLALFESLQRLRNLATLLIGMDPDKLQALFLAMQAIRTATSTKDRVLGVVSLLKIFVTMSSTTVDDMTVSAIDQMLQNQALLDLTVRLVDKYLSGSEALATDAEFAEAQALGLGWGELISAVKLIVELVRLLS